MPETAHERQEIGEDQMVLETSGLDTTYWEYEYDLVNRMVQAKKNGQVVASYVYDPTGLRIKKTGSTGTYRYVYSGSEVILKVDTSNNKQSRYIYVLGKTFAREDVDAQNQTTTTYFHTDIQGNIIRATDDSGNTKWKRDFLPFGMSASEEGNVDEETGFTGKEFDETIGMYYFSARWYDPDLGRFVEEEPIGMREKIVL